MQSKLSVLTSRPRRTIIIFTLLGLASGIISGALPGYFLETYNSRTSGYAPIAISYLWPGTIFGLVFVGYFRRFGLFEGWRGWVMLFGSTMSFVVSIMAMGAAGDHLGLDELYRLPAGAFVGTLFFMLVASNLTRLFRAMEVIFAGALMGGLLTLPFYDHLSGLNSELLGIIDITATWQAGMALTLALLATWRARKLDLSSGET